MMAITDQGALLLVWIAFLVLTLIGVFLILIWAVRARQFSGQDRARHLPLRSDIPREDAAPPDDGEDEQQQGSKHASV
jgi:nitrogen fixation-related uncharacterized protein